MIRVSVVYENTKTRVSIANSGKEIPSDMLPFIFDRFYKTDKSRGVDSNSMGLGLFIVKSILNMHGEDINVTSRDGVTTFTFTLPAASEKNRPARRDGIPEFLGTIWSFATMKT